MEVEYIESGRFEYPTLWIKGFKPLASYSYPFGEESLVALNVGQALDLWKALTNGLVKAGQSGMLDAGLREGIANK